MADNEQPDKEKLAFFLQEGQKWLDNKVAAYDAISAKAGALLGITVPLIPVLVGLAAASHASSDPKVAVLVLPALIYGLFLLVASVLLSVVVFLRGLVNSGRNPGEYFAPEIVGAPIDAILQEECRHCQLDIRRNESKITTAVWCFTIAMALFLIAPLVILAVVIHSSSLNAFLS